MITAHLPSGYLLGRGLGLKTRVLMGAALLGAVFPDFDMVFFHLVDERAFHHHKYWVHAPGFWLLLSLFVMPILAWCFRRLLTLYCIFVSAVFLHIILDSIAGGIMWLWPYSSEIYTLITVEPSHNHWVLSFLLHWTFLLEVVIWIAAIILFWKDRKNG